LQEQQIRDTLKVTQSTDTFITTFDDIIFEDRWDYLDIAFLNHLWDKEWGLSELFPLPDKTSNKRKKDMPSADVAKILTFCRCLNPGSYFSTAQVSHPKIKTPIVWLHASVISAICWS